MLVARITDMHVCPMVTPGTPPIPHVGGPIVTPAPTSVLIGGLPVAGVGSTCVCVGPPDVIVPNSNKVFFGGVQAAKLGDSTAHGGKIVSGCPTVMIGTGGMGMGAISSVAAGAASKAAALANEAAQTLQNMKDERNDIKKRLKEGRLSKWERRKLEGRLGEINSTGM